MVWLCKRSCMSRFSERRPSRGQLIWEKDHGGKGGCRKRHLRKEGPRGLGNFCKWSKRCYLMGEKTNKVLGSSRNNNKEAGWWWNRPKRGQADGGKRPKWAELKGRKTPKKVDWLGSRPNVFGLLLEYSGWREGLDCYGQRPWLCRLGILWADKERWKTGFYKWRTLLEKSREFGGGVVAFRTDTTS